MQKDVHDTIDTAAGSALEAEFSTESLTALAERLAKWATRDMHDNDSAQLRSRTYALAGAIADWADALEPERE